MKWPRGQGRKSPVQRFFQHRGLLDRPGINRPRSLAIDYSRSGDAGGVPPASRIRERRDLFALGEGLTGSLAVIASGELGKPI